MRYGQNGIDWEIGVNYERLRKDRLEKARKKLQLRNLNI